MARDIKKLLDGSFSKFIRLRDSGVNGYGKCISCGKIDHWQSMHNGHYVNRRHMGTRYDEKNCNMQCPHCNTFDEGNAAGYTIGLIDKYGEGIIEELLYKKHSFSKLSKTEMEAMHKHYLSEVKRLKQEKI